MKKLTIPFLFLLGLSVISCTFGGGSNSSSTGGVPSSSEETIPGMTLTWNDEFDGEELDTSYWSYDLGGGGWGNNELECYTRDNATVANGTLSITAKKETQGNYSYTSSRIKTVGKALTTYGRIEAKIKLSAQNAMWPAFWMMPQVNNGWPTSGEIDIMENKGSDAYSTSSALHYTDGNGNGTYQAGSHSWSKRYDDTTIEDWHVYYVTWDEDEFNFYVDDSLKLNVPKRTWHPDGGATYTSDDDAPFNKDFYVILNLAVGGNFDAGRSPDADFSEATMEVDYVRMYQYDEYL